ncbi:VOC family protein [Streptomyces cadmiisoli]|uniref:VOC family protein n=1 Tax=Streptomyces cadmiisoli TaxID=2184053 RepID=UPI003D705551
MTISADMARTVPVNTVQERAVVHHLAFKVTTDEFDAMIAWYQDVLDMEVNFRGYQRESEVCFLSNDEANHRLVFVTNPAFTRDAEYGGRARLDHSAFEFPTVDGLLTKYAYLRDHGIHPYLSIDHGLTISFYYRDPVGHGVEIQTDALGDWQLSREWIRAADEFATNPAGILFDPDRVIDARNRGAGLEELHRRIYVQGEFAPRPDQRQRMHVHVDGPYVWDHSSWGPDHPTFGPH